MFKGLRTKIETEQKVQGGNKKSISPHSSRNNNDFRAPGRSQDNQELSSTPIQPCQSSSSDISTFSGKDIPLNQRSPIFNINETIEHEKSSAISGREAEPEAPVALKNGHQDVTKSLNEQVIELSDQLKSLMKEKEEGDDQNAQLYQLIENLRRKLENEKETNSSLRSKVNELEVKLDALSIPNVVNQNITSKSFKPLTRAYVQLDEVEASSDAETMRLKNQELKDQLSSKTRLLKINQQNLNDIKKLLQKEIVDHEKTREELLQCRKQLEVSGHHKPDKSNRPEKDRRGP